MPDIMAPAPGHGAQVERLPRLARLLLRGDPAVLGPAFQLDLPTAPCTSAAGTSGDTSALWLGPDEWLLLAPAETRWPDWESERGAAFDIGHRQIALQLQGERAEAALAVGCPLDVARLPVGFCSRTVFGKAEIVLWRREPTVFHIEVWRSFAAYVTALLDEGVRDLGDAP